MRNAAVQFSEPVDEEDEESESKAIAGLMNYARNRTKHIREKGDDDIKFDPKTQAKDILNRAVTDYYNLMNYLPFGESAVLRRFNELGLAKRESPH